MFRIHLSKLLAETLLGNPFSLYDSHQLMSGLAWTVVN